MSGQDDNREPLSREGHREDDLNEEFQRVEAFDRAEQEQQAWEQRRAHARAAQERQMWSAFRAIEGQSPELFLDSKQSAINEQYPDAVPKRVNRQSQANKNSFEAAVTSGGSIAMHKPGIILPRSWIERRLEEATPSLSRAAIADIETQRDSLRQLRIELQSHIRISYVPQTLKRWVEKYGRAESELLGEIEFDLRRGLAVQSTSWTTRDGQPKVCVAGTRWRVVVRPQSAKNSPRTLAVLDGIDLIDVPTRQTQFVPPGVSFHQIWDEIPADPNDWGREYSACCSRLREIERHDADLASGLRDLRERRSRGLRDVNRSLNTPRIDSTVQERTAAHGMIRRKFSALRVMMDLLRHRSDQDKKCFSATVVQGDLAEPDRSDNASESKQFVTLRINEPVPAGLFTEDGLLELYVPDRSRPKRTRIRTMRDDPDALTLELDLAADSLGQSELIEVHTVARFGMWAHQRAIHDLFEERVEGYWPALAQLLCSPNDLASPAPADGVQYFCDIEPDRPKLNEQQRAAVAGAIGSDYAFCIQGPPGTGKTTVICELVQHLLAKRERVLLVAPTHVAIDEVLRRIGTREGVRALRLSWDDDKVAHDTRRFMPDSIIDLFLQDVGKGRHGKQLRWSATRLSLAGAVERLERLARLCELASHTIREEDQARAIAARAGQLLFAERPELHSVAADMNARIPAAELAIAQFASQHTAAEHDVKVLLAQAPWPTRILGWFGLGSISQARRRCSELLGVRTEKERQLRDFIQRRESADARLAELEQASSSAEQAAEAAVTKADNARRDRETAETECRAHPLIGEQSLEPDAIRALVATFLDRDLRLGNYSRLAERFDELIVAARQESQDLDGLRRELVAMTNLFCCTTTGVAGSPELRDVVFDTLIVDEASRVTDSEFLIGAVRARRWVLVGDEYQLPPYVEQNDEHFIHALSALHQTSISGEPLEKAVDALGNLWEEDDELHRFRRESVLRVAERIRASGEWDSTYRAAYQTGIEYLTGEVGDPSRALLQAMRESLIHSLFERVVQICPQSMKVRLVEQRRMIEPIAAIVSDPVYRGDYQTPAADELARIGVTPLTTPTFPTPITFLDTSLLGIKARDNPVRNSFINETEARWTVEACRTLDRELSQAGEMPTTVSILAFYKAQARLIREQLSRHRFRRLRFSVIDAIDRIQGQESDIVFLSFCRTSGKNVSPAFGQWLQDVRRLNVACTRAHRALILVGQRELLERLCANAGAMEFYKHLAFLLDSRPDVMRIVRQFGGERK